MAEIQIGIALFGLGRIGSIHVKNVLSNVRARLLYVVEADEFVSKAEQFLGSLHVDNVQVIPVSKSTMVLQDNEVEAVMICTPTYTHEKLVLDALRADKAVFCEKPLTNTVESTVRCYEEAKRFRKPLLCSLNRRFDPGHATVIEKAKNGSLGTIHTISTVSRDGPVVQPTSYLKMSGVTIFHDSGTHDIDMVLKIAGEPPTTVYAQAHAFVPFIAELGDVDCLMITFKFPSGILGFINIDRLSPYGYDQRLEVLGEKSMMISDNPRQTAVQVHNSQGSTLDTCFQEFPQRYNESYKNALDHFIDVIQGKADLQVTAQDVILTFKVADACQESYTTQQVVKFAN